MIAKKEISKLQYVYVLIRVLKGLKREKKNGVVCSWIKQFLLHIWSWNWRAQIHQIRNENPLMSMLVSVNGCSLVEQIGLPIQYSINDALSTRTHTGTSTEL